jgi:Raf kinase inhibitor-like YbhB/YbcL family protein
MKVYCPALLSGKYLPTKYAGTEIPGGQNISPPLSWGDVPAKAQSFVLTIIDKLQGTHGGIHWIVANMSLSARGVVEGASGVPDRLPPGSLEIRNSFGKLGYTGPHVKRASSPREYLVTVYALTTPLDLGPFSSYEHVVEQLSQKVSAQTAAPMLFQL